MQGNLASEEVKGGAGKLGKAKGKKEAKEPIVEDDSENKNKDKKESSQKEKTVAHVTTKKKRSAAMKVTSYSENAENDEADDDADKFTITVKPNSVEVASDERTEDQAAKKAKSPKVLTAITADSVTSLAISEDQPQKKSKKRKSDSMNDLNEAHGAASRVSSSSAHSLATVAAAREPHATKQNKKLGKSRAKARTEVQDENAMSEMREVKAKMTQKKGKAKQDQSPLSPVSSEVENITEGGMEGMKKKKRKLGGKQRVVYDIDNITVGTTMGWLEEFEVFFREAGMNLSMLFTNGDF